MRSSRTLLVGLLLAAVATVSSACTGGPDRPSADRSSGTASRSATPSATPRPRAPRLDSCYALSAAELTRPANGSDPVPCTSRHTARTIFVGRIADVVRGHTPGADSAVVQRQLARTCPRHLAGYVGGSTRTRRLSRFEVVWFSPTSAESDAGADWFRCDVVVFGAADRLLQLPSKSPLRGALDRPGGLDSFGLCGTAPPGSGGFRRVVCQQPHSWRAFDTVDLAGGAAYPGAAKVRSQGEPICKARARSRAADTLKFRYGWEWPTQDQWAAGQHFGYCWAPASA